MNENARVPRHLETEEENQGEEAHHQHTALEVHHIRRRLLLRLLRLLRQRPRHLGDPEHYASPLTQTDHPTRHTPSPPRWWRRVVRRATRRWERS